MTLVVENGFTSVNKDGEELCGDNVAYVKKDGYTTVVLADGLGSGVKANILSILTSKILCTMVSNNIEMEECIETIIQSLPVCKVREIAYSTFTCIHTDENGEGQLLEFDNPQAIYYHNGICQDFDREKLDICGKTVFRTNLKLKENDIIITMSDGTIHAGVGKILNFGWHREAIKTYLSKTIRPNMSARCVSCLLTSACNDLYLGKPGDDTTVACVRIREKVVVDVMIGAPIDKSRDDYYIETFINGDNLKVVCGGTTSNIVAKYLHKEIKTNFDFPDKEVPPIASIDGIDLTTEGVLTLRKLLSLSEKYLSPQDITPKYFDKKDGASLLANMLFEVSTDINFYVGQSINKAHEGLPIDTTLKLKLVESLSNDLQKMGKIINIEYR